WDWNWQRLSVNFNKEMTDEMKRKGVNISFEKEVDHVAINGTDSVTTVKDKNGNESEIHAKFVIDCSGYGRVLPRQLQLEAPSKLDPNSAIFTHIKDVNRPKGTEATQITFDILDTKSWVWVIPFSNGYTSFGI